MGGDAAAPTRSEYECLYRDAQSDLTACVNAAWALNAVSAPLGASNRPISPLFDSTSVHDLLAGRVVAFIFAATAPYDNGRFSFRNWVASI